MKIVRVANFVAPRSGGLKTALRHLGVGYTSAGHETSLIIPGPAFSDSSEAQGRVITLPGPLVPGVDGYRVLLDRRRLTRTLHELRPDRIEISDRTTLRWLGPWARRHGIPSMMVSHESLDGLLRLFGPASGRRIGDLLNRRTAQHHDTIVCTTRWAAAEFERIGMPNVLRVPLGVDLHRFTPARHDPALRSRWAAPDDVLLLHCGRLSPEKKPRRSLAAVQALRSLGVRAVLVIAGAGPLRNALQEEAADRGLPVRFIGHVSNPVEVATLQASVDVAIAPGPIETFGLSALETLAGGTPVVVSAESALPEVIGDGGLAVDGEGPAYAAAVQQLMSRPETERRAAARAQAEKFPWSASIAGFLAAHEAGGLLAAHEAAGLLAAHQVAAEPLRRDAGRA